MSEVAIEEEEDEDVYYRRESNTELVARLMDFSKHGGMMQMFVVDALHSAIDAVLEDEQAFRDAQPERGWINIDGWVGCAKEMKDALDNRRQIKGRY